MACDSLEAINDKFRKLVGSDATVDNMEPEMSRLLRYVPNYLHCVMGYLIDFWYSSDTDQRLVEAEAEATTANKNLSQAEATLSNLKGQLKDKREELKGLFISYDQLNT